MKHLYFLMAVTALSFSLLSCNRSQAVPEATGTLTVDRVEPLCWWTDMATDLTLLVHGDAIADADVHIAPKGLKVRKSHNAESKNYLFLDMAVSRPGTYTITLTAPDGRQGSFQYEILPRPKDTDKRKSFSSADAVYLIMSDRFVDGDPSNNTLPETAEACNKDNVDGRFGGDIAGIMQMLQHIADLGATAVWPTPLLCDNEAAWSYHGYACSDYYHIDPRYGTNELYRALVDSAHAYNIKMIMDMVPNHCGSTHWWMRDLPYHDWVNMFDKFTPTPNVFSAQYDFNASEYDRNLSNRGWFDHPMPDMNLENPDLNKYFIQWAIWWVMWAGVDGLRVDTYPYMEKEAAARWIAGIRNELPWLNIVGETWTRPAPAVAYWQGGAANFDGFDSHLPSVMDFPTEEAIRQALENDGNYWGGGLTRVYDAVAMDYLYADVNELFTFVGNHDMDRFADVVKDNDPRRVCLGHALLATMRGIPQLFYGDEYAMRSADRSRGHSTLRMPMPTNPSTLTQAQRDVCQYIRSLFRWRQNEPVLWTGKTLHFLSRDNTYAFFRYDDETAIFVFANASENERVIPLSHYAEILSKYDLKTAVNPLTGVAVEMPETEGDNSLIAAPVSTTIIRLTK
ncbi:MAG: cyclomaltodextrinase N-terminal domain-containing protein [Paludibacteraceae bacterium]|nr:cyclomaltodextrinase N-terminal domain-containing protein [Paludibacteraceae bacterium]